MATSLREHLLVAAIDFDTTYSGYAFSFSKDYKNEPWKTCTNSWIGSRGLLSLKAPTCVLFDPKKTFHSFGYEAEDKYAALSEDGEEKVWYYFRRFKMTLYNKMILRDFQLETDDGKKLPAMTVFTACIKYLADHLFQSCHDKITGIERTDIRWVLTVPAIWNDVAKHFMREAAEKAGIPDDQLLIALEPEAASLFCSHVPTERLSGVDAALQPFQPGSKYMVLDAGGGTIDITVHEVLDGGKLRELYMANGGDWGGTNVDKAFINLLTDIIGCGVLNQVDEDDKSDLLDLYREFEVKKRNFKPNMNNKVIITVPVAFCETFERTHKKQIKDVISSMKYKGKINWVSDKLRIEPDVVMGLFDQSCDAIVQHLKKLFSEPVIQDVCTILMVGGYSESPILQKAVRKMFTQKMIIIPQDASLAVLNGAVMFGHNPDIIVERVCRYTYGSLIKLPFIHGDHPISKLYVSDVGEEWCDFLFLKIAAIGDHIMVGKPQFKERCRAVNSQTDEMNITLYISTDRDPKYVTDDSCTKLGNLCIKLLQRRGQNRHVSISYYISGTEIKVEALEENAGKVSYGKFDFLG